MERTDAKEQRTKKIEHISLIELVAMQNNGSIVKDESMVHQR
jgi:hypothetical protein